MDAPVDDLSREIHQDRFNVRPVQTNTEGIGAVGGKFQNGCRLPAAAVMALARFEYQAFLNQILNDRTDCRVRELNGPGEFSLGGFAGASQDLQHDALVVAAQLCGIGSSTGRTGLVHLSCSSQASGLPKKAAS